MTYGTSTAFKSGTGIGIIVAKKVVDDQRIEPGHSVQYDLTKLSIPKKPKKEPVPSDIPKKE